MGANVEAEVTDVMSGVWDNRPSTTFLTSRALFRARRE